MASDERRKKYHDQVRGQYFTYDSTNDTVVYEDGIRRPRPDRIDRSLVDPAAVPRSEAPKSGRASSSSSQAVAPASNRSAGYRPASATQYNTSSSSQSREPSYTYGATPTAVSPPQASSQTASRGRAANLEEASQQSIQNLSRGLGRLDIGGQPSSQYGSPYQASPSQYTGPVNLTQSRYPATYSLSQQRSAQTPYQPPPSSSSVARQGANIPKARERIYLNDNGLQVREALAPDSDVRTAIATSDLNPSDRITDPNLLQYGVLSQGMLVGTGNEGEQERLFSTFKVRPHGFFVVGRVFLVLWVEPAGTTVITNIERDDAFIPGRYQDEFVYSKVRRFVVIREGDNYCSALPIASYGHRGVGKTGVNKSEHAIIHTGENPPSTLPAEEPKRGEPGMRHTAIRVIADNPTDKLDPVSRIDFGKVHTVQHNIKVRSFGMVHPASMNALLYQFKNAWNRDAPVASTSYSNQTPTNPTGRPTNELREIRPQPKVPVPPAQPPSRSGGSVRSGRAGSIASAEGRRGPRTINESLEEAPDEDEDEEDERRARAQPPRTMSRAPVGRSGGSGYAQSVTSRESSSSQAAAAAARGAQQALERLMRGGSTYQQACLALITLHRDNHPELTMDQAKNAVLNLLNGVIVSPSS